MSFTDPDMPGYGILHEPGEDDMLGQYEVCKGSNCTARGIYDETGLCDECNEDTELNYEDYLKECTALSFKEWKNQGGC